MPLTTRPGRRNAHQAAAFEHPDVRELVDAVLAFQEVALLKIARQAIIQSRPTPPQVLRRMLGVHPSDELVAAAQTVSEAGARIAGEPDDDLRKRRKGAVLERLVLALVSARAATEHEVDIRLDRNPHTRRQWSFPKEVVVPQDDPTEAYECKFDGRGLDQADVDELGDIHLSSEASGSQCHATVAIMASGVTLEAVRPSLQITEPLFFAELDDLLDLRFRPAARRLN